MTCQQRAVLKLYLQSPRGFLRDPWVTPLLITTLLFSVFYMEVPRQITSEQGPWLKRTPGQQLSYRNNPQGILSLVHLTDGCWHCWRLWPKEVSAQPTVTGSTTIHLLLGVHFKTKTNNAPTSTSWAKCLKLIKTVPLLLGPSCNVTSSVS